MVVITRGITPQKPVSSQRLAALFDGAHDLDGSLYIGYPMGTAEGVYLYDAIWLSPTKGVVIIGLVEGRDVTGYIDTQDDCYNKLEAKLKSHRKLMQGRSQAFTINTVTFAPASPTASDISSTHALSTSESDLINWLEKLPVSANAERFNDVVEAIQSISSIRKSKTKRETKKDNSRGARLKQLEDSISNLDAQQNGAVMETVEGVQRIRGLAGSGKTIVLALKAAYLHATHPDWKIAVTFHTRSLKGQFKRFINTFVIDKTGDEPNWNNLHILHSWGASGLPEKSGLYFNFCQTHGIECWDLKSAQAKFPRDSEFEGVCQIALDSVTEFKPQYDVILVDEAQDFSPAFLRLCYEYLHGEKRLVYAYDELQSLSNNSLPSPEIIFGNGSDGKPRVQFGETIRGAAKQDIILERCYRNSGPVLATAHALGFGIYRKPEGLIQMFENSILWEEVGYSIETGFTLADGQRVVLKRTEESSPLFLENHSPKEDLIQFVPFSTDDDQANWLVTQIIKNLNEDELLPDDIVVINPNPITTRKVIGKIRKMLFEQGINTHLAGVDTSPDVFYAKDSITFTGVHRAKGNEAGMVYVINAQDCYSAFGGLARIRNRLFTAITRSKAWVRVCGYGQSFVKLQQEFNEVANHDFKLDFVYPTAEERKRLNIVNRDMSEQEKQKIKRGKGGLSDLLQSLESGEVFLDDLPEDDLNRLKRLISGAEK